MVRLINSLSHATEKDDVLLLIKNIEKKIDNIDNELAERYCHLQKDEGKCKDYKRIIEDYRRGIIQPNLKSEIKSLSERIIESQGCRVIKFHELNKNLNDKFCQKYEDYNDCKNYQLISRDYRRVQDIQKGYLIDIGEVFMLFFLSFLMFSLREFVQQVGSSIASGGFSLYSISNIYSTSPLIRVIDGFKHQWQNFSGSKLESLGSWATHLPNRFAGGQLTY